MEINTVQKPKWLKIKYNVNKEFRELRQIVHDNDLHTVCEEARCPNQGECWRAKTATIMILGNSCTRDCRFCAVSHEKIKPIDPDEPQKVGKAVKLMGLKYCVITSVTRDDLKDGGAKIWADSIREIYQQNPNCKVEVLIPDFKGDTEALKTVINANPFVVGHNLETVRELYSIARPQADYFQSLQVITNAKKLGKITKTGIMLGLGETKKQVLELMQDAYNSGCDIFTAGQYLQPTKNHLPVIKYITPEEFEDYKVEGLKIGFKSVMSGPLVRSSYQAEKLAMECFGEY